MLQPFATCEMCALQDGQNTITFTYGRQRIRAYLYYIQWHCRSAPTTPALL